MEKGIHIFFSLYRDYCNSLTLSNASELFWSWVSINISKWKSMKRMNFVIACLRPSQNMKLGIFTGSRAVDGKEMYKKVWCTCKALQSCCFALSSYCLFDFLVACIAWRFTGFVEPGARAAKPAPISSRFLCPRPPLLLSTPNQNRHAMQANFLVAAASLSSYYLRYIVMSQKQNILGANWIAPADSIPNVFSTHR